MSNELIVAVGAFGVTAVVALCGGIAALFNMIGRARDGGRSELRAAETAISAKLEANEHAQEAATAALQDKMFLLIEGAKAEAAKGTHSNTTAINTITLKIEADFRRECVDLRRELETLRSTMVRKEEMSALEVRWTAVVTELKTEMRGIGEKLQVVPLLNQQLTALGAQVDKLVARSEGTKA